jgi:nicotinamidase-related amidase
VATRLHGGSRGYRDLQEESECVLRKALGTELQIMNVDTLVICGVSTSGCVRVSTMDAICHGFRAMVRTKS